jgi:hypothetical protein
MSEEKHTTFWFKSFQNETRPNVPDLPHVGKWGDVQKEQKDNISSLIMEVI